MTKTLKISPATLSGMRKKRVSAEGIPWPKNMCTVRTSKKKVVQSKG